MDINTRWYLYFAFFLFFIFYFILMPFYDGIKMKRLLNRRNKHLALANKPKTINGERRKLLRSAKVCLNEVERIKKCYAPKLDVRKIFFCLGHKE